MMTARDLARSVAESENPVAIQAILDAEQAREKGPRKTVVAACEARLQTLAETRVPAAEEVPPGETPPSALVAALEEEVSGLAADVAEQDALAEAPYGSGPLQSQLLRFIESHPGGVTITKMIEVFGVPKRRIVNELYPLSRNHHHPLKKFSRESYRFDNSNDRA